VATGRFDVALLVLGDQFALMLAEAGVPVRVGVRGHALAPCLTHEYDIGSARMWGPDERLNALRVLGFDVAAAVPRLHPSAGTLKSGVDALARIRAESVSDPAKNMARQRYAVVHPFGSTRRQWWPVDRVNELARHVAKANGLPTVLIGGGDTRAANVPLPPDGLDARGRLSVRELVGVLAGADLVVSTDSGPFHIGGALGRPLIGLFRARRPEHATRYPQAHVRFGEFESCTRECEWDRCAAESCRQMADLSVDAIASAVDTECSAAAR
jgi:heptosyltransferase-1